MAITTIGSISFLQQGKPAKMRLSAAQSLADIEVFARALAEYTTAGIVEISFTEVKDLTDLPGATSNLQALDAHAMLLLHGEVGKTKTKRLPIPAPKTDLFELIHGELLVKRVSGGALAAAYSILAGEQFAFIRGRRQ